MKKRIPYKKARELLTPVLDEAPGWADGVFITRSSTGAAARPLKKSRYDEHAYYYGADWRPIREYDNVHPSLHMVALLRDGRVVKLKNVSRDKTAKYQTLVEER